MRACLSKEERLLVMIRQLIYKIFSILGTSEIKALDADCADPRTAQERKLKEILSRNADTTYGREHSFATITDAKEFRQKVPINQYEDLQPYIERMLNGERNVLTAQEPFMYATTSGTTGSQKFIPVNEGYIKEFRHASVASGFHTLKHYPKIAEGVTLTVFSPAEEGRTAGGIPYGAISGGLYLREPGLVKKFIAPIPYSVYLIRDYESKYYTLLRVALMLPVTCIYTLNPSTIALLLKRLDKYGPQLVEDIARGTVSTPVPLSHDTLKSIEPFTKPDSNRAEQLRALLAASKFQPKHIWSNLQVVCCWTKAAAAFYLSDFSEYFGNTPVCDISYGASEGRGTISLGDGRQLLSLRSHFFEFVPEDQIDDESPEIFLADQLEQGKNYQILFTTSAGLYRYRINDVVQVTGTYKNTPLLEFQYKSGNVCSFTGEKLTELHVTRAMTDVLATRGWSCRYFTLIPVFRPLPHYELLFEPDADTLLCADTAFCQQLSEVFDKALCVANSEYANKRESGRLSCVEVLLVEPGAYEALRKETAAAGAADAQFKPSHLNPKADVTAFFRANLRQVVDAR
ncbi:MAG: GH3 auxin-responsive promoter family protein [Candidatus Obscuribacterales bacterium]|nr:GH3 auxin-responsive promoter family protein [Candidatus Obscuribacterales bacterium]